MIRRGTLPPSGVMNKRPGMAMIPTEAAAVAAKPLLNPRSSR
jgi:hypothetical protein